MNSFLVLIIIGAIVGALARLIKPGPQPMGILVTILIGIVGAFVGNYIGERISPDNTMHWILSVVVAIILVSIYAGATGRRSN